MSLLEHLSGIADAASDDPARLLTAHDDFLGGWTAFELEWQRVPSARLEAVAHQLIARGTVIVPTLALHEAFSRMADADLMSDPALADVPPAVLRDAWNPADIMGRARWTPATLAQFKQTLPVLQRFVGMYLGSAVRSRPAPTRLSSLSCPAPACTANSTLYVASGLSPAEALSRPPRARPRCSVSTSEWARSPPAWPPTSCCSTAIRSRTSGTRGASRSW